MASFVARMVGAARLDPAMYEEVEADRTATGQALAVVALSSLASGIGGIAAGEQGFIGGLIVGLVGWVVWAFLTWIIGTKLLPEPTTQSDMGELLRTLGFASAPGFLRVFGWIPVLGGFLTSTEYGQSHATVDGGRNLEADRTRRRPGPRGTVTECTFGQAATAYLAFRVFNYCSMIKGGWHLSREGASHPDDCPDDCDSE